MALSDDLDGFFSDFAVTATSGGTTAKGILDQPTNIEVGGQVLFVDYLFHCKTSDFGNLLSGDSITIDSVAYVVREVQKDADGLTSTISVSKT